MWKGKNTLIKLYATGSLKSCNYATSVQLFAYQNANKKYKFEASILRCPKCRVILCLTRVLEQKVSFLFILALSSFVVFRIVHMQFNPFLCGFLYFNCKTHLTHGPETLSFHPTSGANITFQVRNAS